MNNAVVFFIFFFFFSFFFSHFFKFYFVAALCQLDMNAKGKESIRQIIEKIEFRKFAQIIE